MHQGNMRAFGRKREREGVLLMDLFTLKIGSIVGFRDAPIASVTGKMTQGNNRIRLWFAGDIARTYYRNGSFVSGEKHMFDIDRIIKL